jgi:hypothetical protein
LRREDLNENEVALATMGTTDRKGIGGRGGREREIGWWGGSGRRESGEPSACAIELVAAGGTPEAVVPHLGTTPGQDVLEEAAEKLDPR